MSAHGEFTVAIPTDWEVTRDSREEGELWPNIMQANNPGSIYATTTVTTLRGDTRYLENLTELRTRELRDREPRGYSRFLRTSTDEIEHPSNVPVAEIKGRYTSNTRCQLAVRELIVFANRRHYLVNTQYCVEYEDTYRDAIQTMLDTFRPIP